MSFVSPSQLKEKILEHKELALVDVRSEGAFAGAHLLYAISIPLAKLELEFRHLIPRLETPIVCVTTPAAWWILPWYVLRPSAIHGCKFWRVG